MLFLIIGLYASFAGNFELPIMSINILLINIYSSKGEKAIVYF